MTINLPKNQAFMPRICFLDRNRCTGCGKCQKTYYCDTFLDRVNVDDLPPLMDNRNCNGCGLCVQVCSTGALHLYHPKEMVVLISGSTERRELLQNRRIPFLAYDPDRDLARFAQSGLRELQPDWESDSREKLLETIEKIWEIRLRDRFILGQGKEELYPDQRKERSGPCLKTAVELLDQREKMSSRCRAPLARAAVWSQLIWSDPGQVLWDSFILLLKSVLERKQENVWTEVDIPDDKRDILAPELLNPDEEYRVSSYVVLLRRGRLLLAKWVPNHSDSETEFRFSSRIFDKPGEVEAYNQMEMGKGKLAGLDIRACGSFLVDGFHQLSNDEILPMAGLPWCGITDLLKNGNKEDFEDFDGIKTRS